MIQESGVHVHHARGDRAFYNMQTVTVIGEVHHQVKLAESAAPDTPASTADACGRCGSTFRTSFRPMPARSGETRTPAPAILRPASYSMSEPHP